jgi:hypothetical protein
MVQLEALELLVLLALTEPQELRVSAQVAQLELQAHKVQLV